MKNDPRSYDRNFYNCVKKPEKKSGLQRGYRLCWAPRRLCLWMVFTLANLSDRYSGTRLLTVLNIKDFSCFARLSARLFHLRARRIWADLTSQPDPVIMRAALFCSFSSFWLRPLPIQPHTALQ